MIKKNNVQGEVQTFNNFEIYASLTENSDVLRFEDSTSFDRMAYMSTGDQIIGKAIPDDVFIKSIDEKNHTITVTEPMQITADETIKVLCKVQFFPKDNSKDIYKYRVEDAKNKQASNNNIFEKYINAGKHDEVSQFMFYPAIDPSNYRDSISTQLQTDSKLRQNFNKMCNELYKKGAAAIAQPSTLNCESDMLIDINAYTVFSQDGEKYIMSQKILDYFGQSLDEMSRISDNAKVGVSINGFAKSQNPVKDKFIESSFRKTSKWGTDFPYYIKIGTGKLDDSLFSQTSSGEKDTQKDNTSFWNDGSESFYNDQVYNTRNTVESASADLDAIYDIDEPLFKAQLSEYESLYGTGWTKLQTAIMRRSFNKFIIDGEVSIFNSNLKNLDILTYCGEKSKFVKYCGCFNSLEEIAVDTTQFKAHNFYYASIGKASYAVYNHSTSSFEERKCYIVDSSNMIKNDFTKYIFFINDSTENYARVYFSNGKDDYLRFSFIKNKYFESYNGFSDEKTEYYDEISIGVDSILKESFNGTLLLRENIESDGYFYTEDGLSINYDKPTKVKLTQENIYCDDGNLSLFTYNDGNKVAICQKNNKYFKNIINNVVSFKTESSVSSSGLVEKYFIEGVDGFKFDIDKVSMSDRILSIEKVDLRNVYSENNEHVFFSKTFSTELYLRGIVAEADENGNADLGDTIKFNFGYKLKLNQNSIIEKLKALTNLDVFKPFNSENEVEFSESTLEFGKTKFYGSDLVAPEYIDSSFSEEQNIVEGFTYYKNLLVLEGSVNLKEPTVINFSDLKALDGLEKISLNDSIYDVAYLDTLPNSVYTKKGTIANVVFLGYKEKSLVIGTRGSGSSKDEIHVIACESLDKLRIDDQTHTVKQIEDRITSIIWDNDRKRWVFTTETDDETFAGIYSFDVGLIENQAPDVNIESEDDQNHGFDFNEYQFIKPLRTDDQDIIGMSEDEDIFFNDDDAMLARDFAFNKIDTDCYAQNETKNIPNSITVSTAFTSLSQYLLDTDYNDIEFDVNPENEKRSLSVKSDSTDNGFFIYDRSLGRWRYSKTSSYSFIVKNITQKTHVHLITVDNDMVVSNYIQENGLAITKEEYLKVDGNDAEGGALGQFLWLLPRPELNKNEVLFVLSYSNKQDFQVYSSYGNVKIENMSVKSLSVIKENGKLYTDDRRPKYSNYFYAADRSKKIQMSFNKDGYIAALNGNSLFIKSPTQLWTSADGQYSPSTLTDSFYWKKANIPSQRDLSYLLFDNMSPDDAYKLVNDQKSLYVKYLSGVKDSSEVRKQLYSWLISEDGDVIPPEQALEKITSNEEGYDWSLSLQIDGLEFVPSTEGLYANIRKGANQQYVIPQNIAIQGGVTTEAYLRRQTYMNYLRDYYEIILGCNRLSNIVEDGAKELKVTDNSIVIVTHTDDVLILPLSWTHTRDDIENYNNWMIKSLAAAKEYPSYEEADSYYEVQYGYNDNVQTFMSQNQATTKKIYTIDYSFITKNVQFFAGSSTMNSAAKSFIQDTLGVTTGDFSSYKRPFIAFSQDDGETFTEIDYASVTSWPFNDKNSWVNSIYKSGTYICVVITDGSEYYRLQFKLDLNGENYEVASRNIYEKISGDIETEFQLGFTSSGIINDEVPYTVTDSAFYMELGNGDAIKGVVSSKDSSSVTVIPDGYTPTATAEDYNVRVLVAFDTSVLIDDIVKYLRFDENFFNSVGQLKVAYLKSVSSSSEAGLLFSRNECLELVGTKSAVSTSIPCLAQDVNKTVYSYENGEPIELLNKDNENIFLYDSENAVFLTKRNPKNPLLEGVSFYDMLKNRLSVTSFVKTKAYTLNENYKVLGESYHLNDFFTKNKNSIKFNLVSFDDSNPALYICINDDSDFKLNDCKITEDSKEVSLFYTWPSAFDLDTISDDEWESLINGSQGIFEILKVLKSEGNIITLDWCKNTFRKVNLTFKDGTTKSVIQEKETDTILTKELVSDFSFTMNYDNGLEVGEFHNQSLLTTDTNEDNFDMVYIPVSGYGSRIDNTQWDALLPHEIDSIAFDQEKLMKNSQGNSIYMCDYAGNALSMKNGFFNINSYDEKEITYGNLADDEKEAVVYKEVGDDKKLQEVSKLNFYRIEKSDLSIYVPSKKVSLIGGQNRHISIIKSYFSNVEMSSSATITCKSKIYAGEEDITSGITFTYNDGILTSSTNKAYNNVRLSTEGNLLEFVIKVNGIEKTVSFEVDSTKAFYETSTPFIHINDFSQTYRMQFSSKLKDIVFNSENILGSIVEGTGDVDFTVFKYEERITYTAVSTSGNRITGELDIHRYTPKVYYSSNEVSDINNVKVKVYSEELDVTDSFTVNRENDIVTVENDSIGFYEEKKIIVNKNLNEDTFVEPNEAEYAFIVSQFKDTIKYSVAKNEEFIISGLYGKAFLKKPKYASFKSLIDTNGRTIRYEDSVQLFAEDSIKIKSVENIRFEIDRSFADFGNYFILKVLPIATYYPDVSTMNDSEYFTEVDIFDIDKFGYDRVWINEDVFLPPAFKYDGNIYNSGNMSQYSISNWKNKDNFKVYLADKNGKFVKPNFVGESVLYTAIGEANGDCSNEIYQSHDVRINPYELLYKTSYESYKNKYYHKSYPINPFVINMDFSNEDIINPEVNFYRYRITDGKKSKETVDDYSFDNDVLKESFFENEKMRLAVYHSFESDNSESSIFEGIEYNSIFYSKSNEKTIPVESRLVSNFIINTIESVKNKEKPTVAEITEMGIFSKDDVLLAYMTHPKCQYDTKKNYIAYNLLIQD